MSVMTSSTGSKAAAGTQITGGGDDRYPHVWTWRWRTWQFPGLTARVPWFGDGVDRKGWPCRVIARSTAGNSALIEFPDGTRFVTSRGGIRKHSGEPKNASQQSLWN